MSKIRVLHKDVITYGWLRLGPHTKDYLGWEVHTSKDSEDMERVMIVRVKGTGPEPKP